MDKKSPLVRWETWGVAGIIFGLGVLHLFDGRAAEASKPDFLAYAVTAFEFAAYILAAWVALNARRFFEWLFGLLAEALIKRGVIIAIPTPPSNPIPPHVEAEEQERRRAAEEAARRATDLRRQIAVRDALAAAEGCLAPLAAFAISVTVVVGIYWLIEGLRDAPEVDAPEDQSDISQPDPPGPPPPPCVPTFCIAGADGYVCTVPEGWNPTEIARAVLLPDATETEVALFARRIVNDNRALLGDRTDRQIPEQTPLVVRAPVRTCD